MEEIPDSEKTAGADQTTAVIAIVRRSTTGRETATTTLVAAAEAQEGIIEAEAEAKAREVEAIPTDKRAAVNLVSTETTGHLRVLVEAEDVAAIIRESHATIIHVDDTVKVAHQTGFDIH